MTVGQCLGENRCLLIGGIIRSRLSCSSYEVVMDEFIALLLQLVRRVGARAKKESLICGEEDRNDFLSNTSHVQLDVKRQ